jgi:hypothetical protein
MLRESIYSAKHWRKVKITPIAYPRTGLMGTSQPREDVIISAKPPRTRLAILFSGLWGPVIESERHPNQWKSIASGKPLAIRESTGQ